MSTRLLPFLFLLVFMCFLSSCEELTERPAYTGQTTTGWDGTENAATIPDEIHYFGGNNLPSSVNLTPYLPPVGDQEIYGTCVTWATGYYDRTALYAASHDLNSSDLFSPAYQFSPKDLFLSIPSSQKGDDCGGTNIQFALDKEISRGVATQQTVPYLGLGDCSANNTATATAEAKKYKIDSYREINPITVEALKSALNEGRPVIFGAYVTEDFGQWTGDDPMTASILSSAVLGGHALTIVGYDDSRNAFRIVNSWTTGWGDNGFAWMDYDLMTNPSFIKYAFVAKDKTGSPDPDPDPDPTITGTNLRISQLQDLDNAQYTDPRQRFINWNVANIGLQDLPSSADWDVFYMYYNAYDANDYGVLLHERITDDYGGPGWYGQYAEGWGSSANYWYNVDLPSGGLLSQAMFGPQSLNMHWQYTMPYINGYYYLALVADPFDTVGEGDESDNFRVLTNSTGGPIRFSNGIGYGFRSGDADDRSSEANPFTAVNAEHPNAYRPAEIREMLRRVKAAGKMPAAGDPKNAHLPVSH